MSIKLTQAAVNRLAEDHPTGTQLYDACLLYTSDAADE